MTGRLSNYKSRFIYYFKIAYYQKRLTFNRRSIAKLDVNILRLGQIMSNQPSFYFFTYDSSNKITSMSFFITLIYQMQKGVGKL